MNERVLQYKEYHNPVGNTRNAQAKRREDALQRQRQVQTRQRGQDLAVLLTLLCLTATYTSLQLDATWPR